MGSAQRWRVALAALVLPALVLAALAAGSYRPFDDEKAADRAASTPFVDGVFTLSAVALVALVVAFFWLRWRVPGRRQPARAQRPFSLLAFLAYLTLVTLVVVVFRHGLNQERPVPEGEGSADPAFPTQTVPEERPEGGREPARAPRFRWPLAGGAAALLAAALVAGLLLRRRGAEEAGPSSEQLSQLEAALDAAIDDLRAEPDPRRAVVAAYARMEQALTVLGMPRRDSEAPYEYLARVGRMLQAERSVAALTELFELAKFSDHGVDERMRTQAIEALVAVRDEARRGE